MLPDGRSARAAGCGDAFLDGGCGYDLGTASILGPWHTRLGYLVTTKQL